MEQERHDCMIPSEMVPKCPVCSGNMAMHPRSDQYFVEDENWHEAAGRYYDFLKKMEKQQDKKKMIQEYVSVKKLNRAMVEQLIDYIEVSKRDPETKMLDVEIHWNF